MKTQDYSNHRMIRGFPAFWLTIAVAAVVISGFSRRSKTTTADTHDRLDTEITPEERPYLEAARPFAEAIASREYLIAYGCLSSHAKARMSPNQFVAPQDDAAQKRNEASAVSNAGPEQFARMMSSSEREYGKPSKLAHFNVFSINPVVLSGKATSVEDKLDAVFAIGMMPASVPADIRKASLRAKLIVELSPKQLAEAAKAYGTTPASLSSDPDFQPYMTLKMVLVEESGELKIGYFEFLLPGIWD